MVRISIAAEDMGFCGVWLGEHIISPVVMRSAYPYADSTQDSPAFHAHLPFYDPYAALSFIAAKTERIRLGLSLSIVPLHDPYHLAKSVATIDQFSEGRFLFGIGAGWLKDEFEILDQPWDHRGARMEEALELMIRLWNDAEPRFNGKFYTLPPSGMEPKPLTRPHPPFYFGGTTPIALRRAAQLGDGWIGVGLKVDEARTAVDSLTKLRERFGREDQPLDIVLIVSEEPGPTEIAAFEEAGVHELVVRPWVKGRDALENLTAFAQKIGLSQ